MTQFIVQGTFDSSTNQLLINFNNVPQLSNNQGSPVSPVLQQSTFIRKPSPHFYTSTLGLAGGVGLLVSCVWSVLLPAIGSVGVMTFAYLVNKKFTSLHAKELSQDAAKSHNAFTQQLGSGKGSGNLLDGNIDTSNLPPPILPMSNVANQPNISLPPPPMPGSGNLVGESVNPNIPPPPPPPPNNPLFFQKAAACVDRVEKPSTSEISGSVAKRLLKPEIANDPNRNSLLESIRDPKRKKLKKIKKKFDFKETETLLRNDPKTYTSGSLLKELKSTYERALELSKSNKLKKWITYFSQKVETFEEKYLIMNIENQTAENPAMEAICKETENLDTLSGNMIWIKSLLSILAKREDLSIDIQKRCRVKGTYAQEHIKKLASIDNILKQEMGGSLAERRSAQTSSEDEDSSADEFVE